MYTVIFNYNLPDETSEIYNKLISDGFDPKKIIVVDNGSDKREPPSCSNFLLPENIRFTGQAFMVLSYLLKFFEFEQLLLITTSAGVLSERNYFQDVNSVVKFANENNAGFVASSLIGGKTEDNAPRQLCSNMTDAFVPVFKYQPIAMLVSKKLLLKCYEKSSAYFNLDLKRGWGIDRELQYVANLNGMTCYVARDFTVEWRTNLGHRKKMADESVNQYASEADREMVTVLSKRYGIFWEIEFKKAFEERLGGCFDKRFSFSVFKKWALLKLGLKKTNSK